MNFKTQPLIIALVCAMLVLLGGGVAVGLATFGLSTAQADTLHQDSATPRTITVVGEGTVSAAPDIATINLGVQVNDPEVKAATDQADQIMADLIAALKAEGVADKDIETAYYSLYIDRPFGPDGQPGSATYQLSNSLQVTVRDLDNLTNILSVAIEAGANNINSVSFSIEDPSDLRSEARQQAVDEAKTKAEELADLNGVAVGEVVRISEVIDQGIPFASERALAVGGGGGGITPGDVDINVQLQITYAILQ
ncbi:MAG: SIMPL domain-containing protein [Anaerolineaceae bacterium]|nr:SIMPL domain-containing protein [Anaerolineaceae bacterium]MCB9099396.1 SIMPL domain-containing protein [Anaerolineales bacterium]